MIGSGNSSIQRLLQRTLEERLAALERLSTGSRINRASDDAGGLALSQTLRTQARSLNQGLRNVSDGISLVSVAATAVTELSKVTLRLQELAQQSATGTLTATQRLALDREAQALAAEFDRIVSTTAFNKRTLLDGSLGELGLAAGFRGDSLISIGLGGTMGSGTFTLTQTQSTGGGTYPFRVRLADLNADGNIDLITADSGTPNVAISLGNGDGTFDAPVLSAGAYGMRAWDANAADLNNDGILDLVVGGTAAGFYLQGNGDGTFAAPVTIVTPTGQLRTVEIQDLDGDGRSDLVLGDLSGNILSLLGNGDGTFDAVGTVSVPGAGLHDIQVVDFNGDGALDVAAAGLFGNQVYVSLGNGDGTFGAVSSYNQGAAPADLSATDVNNDGVMDLLASNTADQVRVYIGKGDGTFTTKPTVTSAGSSIVTSDFNGDGNTDFLARQGDGSLRLFTGNGDGTFTRGASVSTGNPGTETVYGVAGDFNKDGVMDVAVPHGTTGTIGIIQGGTRAGVAAIQEFSLRSASDAASASNYFDSISTNLAVQLGKIGAVASRLEFASSVIRKQSLALRTAHAQITDIDVAEENAKVVAASIKQKYGLAAAAHSNLNMKLILKLLSS